MLLCPILNSLRIAYVNSKWVLKLKSTIIHSEILFQSNTLEILLRANKQLSRIINNLKSIINK